MKWGHLVRLYKLAGGKKPISREDLERTHAQLEQATHAEKLNRFGLKPDGRTSCPLAGFTSTPWTFSGQTRSSCRRWASVMGWCSNCTASGQVDQAVT